MTGYRLAPAAARDLLEIAAYTVQTWGRQQADRYEAALVAHFATLARGEARTRTPVPDRPHLLASRCQHHVVFSVRQDVGDVLILAVLHEKMDLMTRLRDRLDLDSSEH